MVHKFYKHKLLFDEGFPPRWLFPRVNERFDVKHIKDDLRKIGLPDTQVRPRQQFLDLCVQHPL